MTVAPLVGKFIQAKGYSRGRKTPVDLLALHTAEGSKTVESLGRYFAGTTKGSSNAGMGQQGQYAEFVTYNNTPWTNPPVNSRADTLEICGFSKWTREEWLALPEMIDGIAHWIAWRAAVRGIPIQRIRDARLSGVLDHKAINDTYHKSTHSDVGPGFPWDVVMEKAASYGKVDVAPQPAVKNTVPNSKEILEMIVVSPEGTYAFFVNGRLYPLKTSQVHTLDAMGYEGFHATKAQWDDINALSKAVAG